jgi:hypothetical protein
MAMPSVRIGQFWRFYFFSPKQARLHVLRSSAGAKEDRPVNFIEFSKYLPELAEGKGGILSWWVNLMGYSS